MSPDHVSIAPQSRDQAIQIFLKESVVLGVPRIGETQVEITAPVSLFQNDLELALADRDVRFLEFVSAEQIPERTKQETPN